ncbi:unnamed protein product [Rhizoctonia solani]|uniref:mRNA cap guanine-N(7) methyltransferase n=1 Tax=Rhizoctonia solani TaxID=456999 RepID=A0A8H2XJP5_9AGAM|nr:unnamed protein product [Rhizoctonia solani]
MSVAVIQGCSKGLGRALAQNLLSTTNLNVVGTTASGATRARDAILSGTSTGSGAENRLTTLDMDIRDESAVKKASEQVQDKFGDKPLRLLINVSGMLHAEKNIKQISHSEALRSFEINVIGHMLAFKHFVPLVGKEGAEDDKGLLPGGRSVLASISARVGSIQDNELGGWYSYRASKAAVNQLIKTLSLELKARKVPAVALAYHPGTVRTDLSKDFVGPDFKAPSRGDKGRDYGIFDPDEAASKMMGVSRDYVIAIAMPMFDPVKDAIENSPVASTQQLPPTPSYKHNILASPPSAPAAPPSPSRRNSVSSANLSMLLNDGPPPSKRQRTASIHHLLSPTDSRPSSSGGLQIDMGSSPGRSTMGPPALPHRSSSAPTPVPYAPRRISAGQRLRVPLTPDEHALMERSCRNALRDTATHSPPTRPSSSSGPDRKRRRGSDDQGEIRPPPGVNGRDDSYMVAQHYNRRKEVGVKARLDSPIIGLRNFNNWIKSVLIAKFGRRPLQESNTHGPNPHGRGITSGKVLDLGCGKGGDLRKWGKASIREYVGLGMQLHIADVSINQARNRHMELVPSQRFDAEFHAFDCFSDNINTVVSPHRLRTPFDVVSMQFCMHYAFESLDKVRVMLENVSQYLRPGGIFLGTIPNSQLLLDTLNKLPGDETSFGNSVYSIRFDSKREQPLYGHRYWFYLKDAVEDVPEYVVRWEEFETLALEYGLKVIHRSDFHDIFALERRDSEFGPLLQTMKVVNSRGETEMSEDQWQAANIYIAFAFEKQ